MFRVRVLSLMLVATALACGRGDERKYGQSASAVTQCPGSTVVQGIDVSHFDGVITWSTVATTSVKFAYAKATQSTDFIDPQFSANWAGMKAHGILRGAYHFIETSPSVTGTAQADYYLAEVASAGGFAAGDLPPMLDWEPYTTGTTVLDATTNAKEFIAEIKLKTGMETIIYTYPDYWNNTLGNPAGFTDEPLWEASYMVTCPEVLAPWTSWSIWQYSATGTVSGVPGSAGMVDLDQFNGSLAQLEMSPVDGGTPKPDAGEEPPDSGTPRTDAGLVEPDGGRDAGSPKADAGSVEPAGGRDAGPENNDAGADTVVDGGEPESPDAGASSNPGGCSCSSGAESVDGLLWIVGALAAGWRRLGLRRSRG